MRFNFVLHCSNKNGDRLDEEDDTAVQAVLKYHPSYLEEAGCGIAYIKVRNCNPYDLFLFLPSLILHTIFIHKSSKVHTACDKSTTLYIFLQVMNSKSHNTCKSGLGE